MKNNTIEKQSAATVKINRHSLLFKVTFVALILGTISMFLSSFLLYTIFRSRAENNLSENMSKTLIACGTQLLQYQSLDWLFSYWQEHYDQMNLPPFETTEIFRKWNLDHDEFYHLNTSSITTEDILNMPEEKQLLFAEYAYLYTFFALSKIRASNDLNDLMIFLPHNSGETAFVFFQSTSDDKPLSDMHMALGKEISSPVKDHSKYLELFENKGNTPSKLEITTYEDVAYATMYTKFSDTLPVFSVSMSMKEMLDDVWADVWAFEKWLAPLFICLLIIFLYILYHVSLKPTMELAYHIRSYTLDHPSDHLFKQLETLSKRGDELGYLSGDIKEMILRNEQYFQQQFENETLKSKILLVQIKPHFIYNSLAVIRSLLDDPEKAEDALNHFAGFLRGSLDILEKNDRIRAEREFEVVDDYLYLLKLRFEDRLTIEKDYQDKDFSLPPFSIQILVENAVKHGIYGTEDKKGTVSIKSYRRDEFHVIEVTDNGVGMSAVHPHDQKSEERLHLGIRNVESRLRIMCAGALTLESIKGKGTTATIRIPVKTDSDSPE